MKIIKNKYFLTAIISLLIISLIFIYKGIFPFGSNSVIWSDLHEQVTALYYKLYDSVRGSGSLFVDFNSGGAINLLGILAYYILSPFSLIVLLFPRDMIPEAVSLIVAFKIVLSGITCLYFVNRYFKKLKDSGKIFLSLLYAFSSYTFIMHLITGWMDIVYLFPLIMVGLKELLDFKDRKLYILTLALALVFNYYLALISLIFIFVGSGIYLYVFNKDKMKKAILNLGISTVISLLISGIILVPALIQTMGGERAALDLHEILNAKLGPLTDKISLLFTSGPLIAFTLLLLINKDEKHNNIKKFLLPLLVLVGIPILIEPINKMLHLGSYVYFTYRFGFIFIFLLVIGAAYYLERVENKIELKNSNVLGIVASLISIALVGVALLKRASIRETIYKLTFSKNKIAFIIMFLLLIFIIVSTVLLEIKKSKKNRKIIYGIALISVLLSSYLYFGFYNYRPELKEKYQYMNTLNELKDETGNYLVKETDRNLITNYGMVTGLRTYSNFTSLTEKSNFRTLQSLGYDSYWMDTSSIGGNLFIDTILGYKYIVTKQELNSPYYSLYKEYDDLKVYKYNKDMPLGYILQKEDNLEHALDSITSSFESSNIIYNYITGKENIFEIKELTEEKDIKKDTVIKETIEVKDKQEVYLEIFTEYESEKKIKSYNSFNIYVNGELFYKGYPNADRNGTLDLGIYENTKLEITIEALKNTTVRNITVGLLNLKAYDSFVADNNHKVELFLDGSSINIVTNSITKQTLLLPIPNLGYQVKGYNLSKAFGNFTGIDLTYGANIIEMTYTPKGILIGMILTIVGLILLLLVDRVEKIYDIKALNNIAYIIYMGIYYVLLFGVYVIGILAFLVSFVHRI